MVIVTLLISILYAAGLSAGALAAMATVIGALIVAVPGFFLLQKNSDKVDAERRAALAAADSSVSEAHARLMADQRQFYTDQLAERDANIAECMTRIADLEAQVKSSHILERRAVKAEAEAETLRSAVTRLDRRATQLVDWITHTGHEVPEHLTD